VIDPASPWPAPRSELDAWLADRDLTVSAILLTHHHHDHVGGAAYLAERTGAPVWAHPINTPLVDIPLARTLEDGDLVGGRLRSVFTPGHAPGHLAFRDEVSGVVVAGDMVAGTGTIVVAPPEGHMGTYLDSLQRLKDEAPTAMIPAHGPLIDDPQGHLDTYIKHRLWREERIYRGLPEDGGAALLMAVTRAAYTDVPEFLHPLAAQSARAHLDHLVELGRAARSEADDTWVRT
jgi:glyoxylase-like metal-dependent hydrolase (beta-lactamase superfamily II)